MSYIVELRTPTCSAAYVLAQAATQGAARALVDAQLARDDGYEEIVIVAVHPIH
jgi:hypothetical protein